MAEESKKAAPSMAAPASPATKNVGVRLVPTGNSDLPILSNYARVQLSPSGVLIDFGFLDPAGMAALARTARAGGKVPESVNGRLAARFALTSDALVTLHKQLGLAIEGLRGARKSKESASSK